MDARPRIKTRHPGVYYRERSDGSRQYMIWYTGTDGRARFENVVGGEGDAVRARARVVDRKARGERVAPSRMTFSDFAYEWLDEQTNLSQQSINCYRNAIKVHLVPRLGQRTKLCEVDVNRVARLVASMQRDGKKAWTIRATLTPLSRIMSTAARRGMAPVNPVPQLDRSERPKGDAAEINILDSDEIKLMLANAPENYKTLLATAVFTGCRVSELLSLRWEDVDWEEQIIHVRGTKSKHAKRDVMLLPFLQQALAQHSLDHEGTVHVFENGKGEPLTRGSVLRFGLRPALEKAGITKHIRFHDLRHTFASLLIGYGFDLGYVAEQMGHSNPSMTLRHYSHLMDKKEKIERARRQMQEAYDEMMGK